MLEKHLSYKYKAYESIKKDILIGKYALGDVLNERALSLEMGISRTPVREALQMLSQDGWVRLEAYKGAVVRAFDLKYMRELSRIRSALEVCAVEDACSNIKGEDIKRLECIMAEQKRLLDAFDVEEYILLDRKFHCAIYDLSRNDELIHLLSNYFDIFRFLGTQAVMNSEERRLTTLQEHGAILEALKLRDKAAASNAMCFHMESTEKNMIAYACRD